MGALSPEDVAYMKDVPYLSCIGSLQYLASMTRSDIAQVVAYLAHFNSNPGLQHWAAVKHLFYYLKGTLEHKLHYSGKLDPTMFFLKIQALRAHLLCGARTQPAGYTTVYNCAALMILSNYDSVRSTYCRAIMKGSIHDRGTSCWDYAVTGRIPSVRTHTSIIMGSIKPACLGAPDCHCNTRSQ